MRQTGPQTGFSGTHAQTNGDESNFEPLVQMAVSTHVQMPPQSAPPFSAPPFRGSQLSLGSSTHLPAPGHGLPAMPPQAGPDGGFEPPPCWPISSMRSSRAPHPARETGTKSANATSSWVTTPCLPRPGDDGGGTLE